MNICNTLQPAEKCWIYVPYLSGLTHTSAGPVKQPGVHTERKHHP